MPMIEQGKGNGMSQYRDVEDRNINEERITSLLRYGERVTLECKDGSCGLPKSVWETYSAFANTIGGVILLGIKENPNENVFEERFKASDLKNSTQLVKEFWDTLNSDKVSISILVDEDVQIISYKGHQIIYINVPQADYRNRPVYINGNPIKGSFKRNYEGDYHCTQEEVRAMFRDSDDAGNDGMLLEGYTMDDIDLGTLRAYRNAFSSHNPEHVDIDASDIDFLRNYACLAKDRKTGKEWLTTAGLLVFGKGRSIRERFSNIRMDYLDKTNLQPDSCWSNRLTYDGMWENNLYTFFRKVLPMLTEKLKRPFQMEGITRIDDTLVHKAIREALTNLIIHSDYLSTGVLKVEKLDQEFRFFNPGRLKIPVQSIYHGYNSVARNPRIQTLFRMLGFGENVGSGFPTILNACQRENWRKPDLHENLDLNQVELRIWMVAQMPEACTVFLNQTFGDAYRHLNANEQIILATTCLEHEVSNARFQSLLDLHPTDIGNLLASLTDRGFLLCNSKGRWTTYRLNVEREVSLFDDINDELKIEQFERKSIQDEPPKGIQDEPKGIQDEPKGIQDEPKGIQDEPPKGIQDEPKGIQDEPKGIQDEPKSIQDEPKGIQDESQGVQSFFPLSRSVKTLLSKMKDGVFTAKELQERCNVKSFCSFRAHYLKPALELGVIEMTVPDKPHSKFQRYRKSQGKGKARETK